MSSLRSTRTLIKKYKGKDTPINFGKDKQNFRVMFLRSPKHFKTGKQFINFFNSSYRVTYNLMGGSSTLLFFNYKKISKLTIFRFLQKFGYSIFSSENTPKRISITTTVGVKF